MLTIFSNKDELVNYLISKVESAKLNGNNCVFVDTILFKSMVKNRDAIISVFQERKENIEMRPCRRGYYDIIITWRNND